MLEEKPLEIGFDVHARTYGETLSLRLFHTDTDNWQAQGRYARTRGEEENEIVSDMFEFCRRFPQISAKLMH